MSFDIGIHKFPLNIWRIVDGTPAPITGLTNNGDIRFIRVDTNSVVTATGFQEVGNGMYEVWGFDVPDITFTNAGADYQGFLEVACQVSDGTSWNTRGQTIQVYKDANQFDGYNDYPPARSFVENRLDRQGDTVFGYITDVPNGTFTALNPSDYQHINKKYATDHFIDSTSGDARYVTITGNQTITGTKTFSGATTYFTNSGTSFWYPYMNSSSPTYINGAPSNSTLVWKKWVVDNFVAIGSSGAYDSNTVMVDSQVPEDISLKIYSTITGAINDIVSSGHASDGTDCWTLFVKQNPNINGYVENVEVPDYINITGDNQVLIAGQLTRVGEETTITSKLQNLIFSTPSNNQNVERFEAVNCVFISTSDANVSANKSILRNCGIYSGSETTVSIGNSKFINCFGNKDIAFQTTDKVYSYNFIDGDTYSI